MRTSSSHRLALFTSSSALTLFVCVFVIDSLANAQPAPLGFTDRSIREVKAQDVTERTETAVLSAYEDAASKMGWDIGENLEVAFVQPFFIPEGSGTQVVLAGHDLGKDGFLFITSEDDRVFQRMSQEDLVRYGGKSAFFPAGKLTISVIHRKGAVKPRIQLDRLRVLHHERVKVFPLRVPTSIGDLRRSVPKRALDTEAGLLSEEIESLCHPDDRARSDDRRVGRLVPVGCTGWLIGEDLALTAGHCDVADMMNILEFQVPSSLADGTTQPALPNDQYPVIRASIKKEFTGIGHDWAVFQVGPNSNTGELPGVAQGSFFKLSRTARPSKARVTGYGVDNTPPGAGGDRNSDSQTQQTENGAGGSSVNYFSDPQAGSYFRYTVDTTGGNSGSPVIDLDADGDAAAIAIHTNAGCETGGNHGTAADNEDLREAIKHFVGDLSKVYVDEGEAAPTSCGCRANTGSKPSPEESAGGEPRRLPIIEGYPDHVRARLEIRNRRSRGLAPKSVFERVILWPQRREITVAFRGGDAGAYEQIERCANQWAEHGNFSLRFKDDSGEYLEWTPADEQYAADIRIAFASDGYWSLLGTDSRNSLIVFPGQPSMNLEEMADGNLSANERGTVIHEFGHALGFHHEHQSPEGGCDDEFRWDDDPGYVPTTDILGQFVADEQGRRPGIYTVLGGPPNDWSRATVDFNLRQLPDSDAFVATPHDPTSIMHYSFPEWMFANGSGSQCFTSRNNVLSAQDVVGVSNAYPKDALAGAASVEAVEAWSKNETLRKLFWMPGSSRDTGKQ